MKITKAMKNWLVENKSVDKDASDEEFQQAAAAALLDGSLSAEKMRKLTSSPSDLIESLMDLRS
jgi:hypothetical protein